MLHLISEADNALFTQCLQSSAKGDAIVLLSGACLMTTNDHGPKQAQNRGISLYVLGESSPTEQTKLVPNRQPFIEIDYHELVDLCLRYDTTLSWF